MYLVTCWSNPLSEIQNKLITRGRVELKTYESSASFFSAIQTEIQLFAFLQVVRSFLLQAMAWLTLLIYRDSLQNLPCIWTTVVACALKRHQITCIWGNYSVFFSGQSQSGKVQKFVSALPVGNCSVGLALQKAAPYVYGVGSSSGTFFHFRVRKAVWRTWKILFNVKHEGKDSLVFCVAWSDH